MSAPKSGIVKSLARKLQRIAEDEMGTRPKYATCLQIADEAKSAYLTGGVPFEEAATRLFLDVKDMLEDSAAKQKAQADIRVRRKEAIADLSAKLRGEK